MLSKINHYIKIKIIGIGSYSSYYCNLEGLHIMTVLFPVDIILEIVICLGDKITIVEKK